MTLDHTVRRVTWRIVPFLILCYFFAYLDRVNVSVAALEMNQDLGLTVAAFGLGAGLFFVGYFLFELPSNLIMQKVGARRWIARIMLSWGLLSGATAFVWDPWSFYAVRFLLGVAEAGFFPAVLLYLSQWLPQHHRARVFSYFLAALPLAGIIGTPVSGALLGLDGAAGLQGWQWLFVLEALPTVLLAPVAYVFLTDRPSEAQWLDTEARARLAEQLEVDAHVSASRSRPGRWANLRDPRVIALTAAHLCGNLAIYGLAIFLPQIVRTIGVGNTAASSIAALPYLAGAAGMIVLGSRLLDRVADPRVRACLPFAVSAVGFALAAGSTASPGLLIAALCVAAFGCFGYGPRFWSTPTAFLAGPALAVAIAVVNSFGNLGGFIGPYTVGALYDATGSFAAGLLACAGAMVLALGLMAFAAPERHASAARPSGDEPAGPPGVAEHQLGTEHQTAAEEHA